MKPKITDYIDVGDNHHLFEDTIQLSCDDPLNSHSYKQEISQEEIDEISKNHTEISKQLSIKQEEAKEFAKNEIKPLKEMQAAFINQIRSGYIEKIGDLYGFKNKKTKQMDYFDLGGTYAYSRYLSQEEIQTLYLELNPINNG